MAIRIVYGTEQSMEFQEFMEYADNHIDFTDQDALLRLGEQLSMLGNNRRFLTDFLADFMADFIEKNVHAGHVPGAISQAIDMGRTKKFYVRFAMWMPEQGLKSQEKVLFAYDQAHDHNFDLHTYAYCGGGYFTDVYEYDYNSVAGYIGEQVASPKIVRLLSDVVEAYPCQRSRYEALRALGSCDPVAHRLLCEKFQGDASPIIRQYIQSVVS